MRLGERNSTSALSAPRSGSGLIPSPAFLAARNEQSARCPGDPLVDRVPKG
jgi:hypothetical protein